MLLQQFHSLTVLRQKVRCLRRFNLMARLWMRGHLPEGLVSLPHNLVRRRLAIENRNKLLSVGLVLDGLAKLANIEALRRATALGGVNFAGLLLGLLFHRVPPEKALSSALHGGGVFTKPGVGQVARDASLLPVTFRLLGKLRQPRRVSARQLGWLDVCHGDLPVLEQLLVLCTEHL